MALKKDVYSALEDVVGPENISEDPIVTETYAMPIRANMLPKAGEYIPRFEAITLPKDTQEVQAIVKLCNRYKIQYKASSTGWLYADPFAPGCIKLDLRRMNHILEINEKNMYAAVEPYVIYAQLQAELMKRGLNCNITGAGSNCSALPLAAHANLGHLSQSGSYGERNLLAVEWVTPDGEIVKMGSLGSLGEWFCGDGPGPSLRGIIRGNTVPLGGLGVFTAAAQKLYHWPGPSTFPIKGVSPQYSPSEIPTGFMIRYISFPSLEMLTEAVGRVGESEIGFILMGFNPTMLAANLATINLEEELKIYEQFSKAVQGPGFLLIIAGNSPNDFEYKRRTLEQIMEETNGKSLEAVEDPQNAGGFIWRIIRVTGSVKETSRVGLMPGADVCSGTDVFPLMSSFIKSVSRVRDEYIEKGWLVDNIKHPFLQSIEHGHAGHGEILSRFSLKCPDPLKIAAEAATKINQIAIDEHFGVPHHVQNDAVHDMYGPNTSNYHLWLRKIKKVFDPNAVSESSGYISAKE
jgi:glycolate oxidase